MPAIKKMSQTSLLLNGAAILLVVASLGVVARSAFVGGQAEPCKERFASGTRLSLESNGEPISAEQLQGSLSSTDWGLTAGARVINAKSGPSKYVLELDLASAPSASKVGTAERAGIGFEWVPQSFGRPQAACLSYSVFIPIGFSFGKGGRLPGLLGTSPDEQPGALERFSMRYTWSPSGELGVYPQLPGMSEGHTLRARTGTFALTPGKWTELQQEVILSAPGESDGILRVWQDGDLVLEKKSMAFRKTPTVSLSGVLAEAVAGAGSAAGRGSQKILLTPFELRRN